MIIYRCHSDFRIENELGVEIASGPVPRIGEVLKLDDHNLPAGKYMVCEVEYLVRNSVTLPVIHVIDLKGTAPEIVVQRRSLLKQKGWLNFEK